MINVLSGEAPAQEKSQLPRYVACEVVNTWKYGRRYYTMANISASAAEMKGTIAR